MPSFSRPAMLLRLESVALLALTIVLYQEHGDNWWLFVILLLAPDLSFAAVAAGQQAGLVAYNLAHTAIAPALLAMLGFLADWNLGITLSIIWFAHLALDRAVGYGLKYSLTKKDTHLDRA